MGEQTALLDVLGAAALPVAAQRALAEVAPQVAARVVNLDPGLRRELRRGLDPFAAPGRLGPMWADLLERTPSGELDEVIASLAVAPDGPPEPRRLAPLHEVLVRCRCTAAQLAALGDAGAAASSGRFDTHLAETVVVALGLPVGVARHWVPMMSTENRFRFVLDHPSDPNTDAAVLAPERIRSAGARTLWLAALVGRFRPRVAAAAAQRIAAADDPDARNGRRAQLAAAQLSLLCAFGQWDDSTVPAALRRAPGARLCGHQWFRAQRLLCDPTVPAAVADAIVEHCGVLDVWNLPARSMRRDELTGPVLAAMERFAAPPRREWHVLAAWLDCPGILGIFEGAAEGSGKEFDAQFADTVAVAEGRRIGLVPDDVGAANTWKALTAARSSARRSAPPAEVAAEMVAPLVEVCGDSEVSWRTAVALADSETTLGFEEVAALVAVGCTESLGQ